MATTSRRKGTTVPRTTSQAKFGQELGLGRRDHHGECGEEKEGGEAKAIGGDGERREPASEILGEKDVDGECDCGDTRGGEADRIHLLGLPSFAHQCHPDQRDQGRPPGDGPNRPLLHQSQPDEHENRSAELDRHPGADSESADSDKEGDRDHGQIETETDQAEHPSPARHHPASVGEDAQDQRGQNRSDLSNIAGREVCDQVA